jgi:hypothetical protein
VDDASTLQLASWSLKSNSGSDNLTLFYIDRRLIVVYIILVVYLVSKCDSIAARGKLNSLSDPDLCGVRFRARSIIVSYRVVVLLLVSYRIVQNENTKHEISKQRSVQTKVRENKKRRETERTDKWYD